MRKLVVTCVLLMIAISLIIFASGQMHAGHHHPWWVNTLSWIFAAASYALLAAGAIALARRYRVAGKRVTQ